MLRFRRIPLLVSLSIACLGAFAGSAVFFAREAATAVLADGPTVGGSVPSNLTLRDNTASEIKSYYASLSSLDSKELQGENLLKNLRPILQNFTYYNYDNCWKMYEITDRDWSLSPAEGISGYNPSTKAVTGYRYGAGYENPYIHPLYRNLDEDGTVVTAGRIRAYGDHNQSGFNREHVWCQSRGFKADNGASGPAGTDIHHLISGDGYVNQIPHNNNPYGFVNRASIKTNAANHATYGSYLSGNLSGAPTTIRASNAKTDVFEPQDSDKGDIARACFYMAACYNNIAGGQAISQFNPNLTIVDYATPSAESEISAAKHPVAMGILSDLLAWHKMDPVDEYERHRNNLIYNNYQHNRNPFIDYPEWVDYIWGRAAYDEDAHRVTVYDSTPTGYVDLDLDQIYGYRDGEGDPLIPDDPEVHATWQKTDSIAIGDEVVIVCEGAAEAVDPDNATILTGIADDIGDRETFEVQSDERLNRFFDRADAYTLIIEEGTQEGTFAFKDKDDKYLGYKGSKNSITAYANKADTTSWIVSFSEGNAVIKLYGTDGEPRTIQWNNASGDYRFATYTSKQRAIQLYKLDAEYEASQWADDFIDEWTGGCNPDGGYIDSNMHWEDASTAFEGLARNTQTLLKEQEENSSILWAAVERYDYIVSKYGSSTFEDFMSRNPAPKASIHLANPLISENKSSFALILAIICIGFSLGSAVLILRRSKHE